MKDLIEALQIMAKYLPENNHSVTHCEHDVMYVPMDVSKVSTEDKARLKELRFIECEDIPGFMSYRFGSC